MQNQIAARDFLRENLPAELIERVDFDTVKAEKETYIDQELQRRMSDILFSMRCKDGKQLLAYTLLEPQSTVDKYIAFRLWKYNALIAERHIAKKEQIPLIVNIVLYNGKKKYTAARNLFELFNDPQLARKLFSEDYRLIDLQAMSDDEIMQQKHLEIIYFVLKHIHMRDALQILQKMFAQLEKAQIKEETIIYDQQNDLFYMRQVLCYIQEVIPDGKDAELRKLLTDNLTNEKEENLMRTLAQKHRDEGRDERTQQIAINMLKQGLDIKVIATITGLPMHQIVVLKQSLDS